MEGLEDAFKKVLSKFKTDEFPDMVTSVFGDSVPWESVPRRLDALRLDHRAGNIADVCFRLYKRTKPLKEDALKLLWVLQLYDVAVHSKRKWFGIKLKDPFPDSLPSVNDIEKNLSRAYRKEMKYAIVYRTFVGRFHYVMAIEEKTTKKGPKYLAPVFFLFTDDVEKPFVFYTPKLRQTHPLDCISSAVGYQGYRQLNISGKDVETLYDSVQRKQAGTVALGARPLDIVPVTYENITDMTGYASRRKYAMNVLKGDSGLTALTLHSQTEWRGTRILPRVAGDENGMIESSLTIQTKNGVSVDNVLREMIAHGNIRTPLPSWVQKFAQQPRSSMKLGSPSVHSDSSGGAFERTDETENSDCNQADLPDESSCS